jgi:hypothetical protein
MMLIFESQCRKNQYTLDETVKEAVKALIEEANTNSISFGNARGVRNVFERVLVQQANRLSTLENPSRDDLMAITTADVDALREMPEGGEEGVKAAVELMLPETQSEALGTQPENTPKQPETHVDAP